MSNTREEYINYRINRAYESLEDARILADNERWNATTNRLYYATFYAVIAILLKNNQEVSTHSGAKSIFSEKFIKTGIIPTKYGQIYSRLFTWRQKSDYDDLFDFDKETILPYLKDVEDFLHVIGDHLK